MSESLEQLRAAYRHAVLMQLHLGKAIAEELKKMDIDLPIDTPFPPCYVTRHDLDGEVAYQFSYDGMLPLYFDRGGFTRERVMKEYQDAVRDYYFRATYEGFRAMAGHETIKPFGRAFVYVAHFFKDLGIRDLDNRNRSTLINALRNVGILCGDEWQRMTYMEKGFLDIKKQNHVSMFVTEEKNALKLIQFVEYKYKNGRLYRITSDEFFKNAKDSK